MKTPYITLLPLQGVFGRLAYPGRCPGLSAYWAFSPLLDRLLTISGYLRNLNNFIDATKKINLVGKIINIVRKIKNLVGKINNLVGKINNLVQLRL